MRGLDLRDLLVGRMSWRRFAVVLKGLPAESEYKTALRNTIDLSTLPEPEPNVYGPWSQTDMLLARLGDLVAHWLWMNADHKAPTPPPSPYPRPGVKRSNVTAISPAALAFLEYKRVHQGADPPPGWEPEVV